LRDIDKFVEEIPAELRRAISSLANDSRAAIFVVLIKNGEMTFSDLYKTLGIDKAKLNFHLKKLAQSALVKHYFKHEFGKEEYSYYAVTDFGLSFLNNLNESLRPEHPLEKVMQVRFPDIFNRLQVGVTPKKRLPFQLTGDYLRVENITKKTIERIEQTSQETSTVTRDIRKILCEPDFCNFSDSLGNYKQLTLRAES